MPSSSTGSRSSAATPTRLMLMAAKQYWEDSGTPTGSDDYGYDGLRNVLLTRLSKASDIRYSMRYMEVRQTLPDGSSSRAAAPPSTC